MMTRNRNFLKSYAANLRSGFDSADSRVCVYATMFYNNFYIVTNISLIMLLDDTSVEENWEYIGSGSANVVFAYRGNLERFKGKVVRLRLIGTDISTKEIFLYLASHAFDKLRSYMVDAVLFSIKKETLAQFQRYADSKGLSLKLDPNENHCLIMNNIFSYSITSYESIELSKYHKFYINYLKNDVLFEFKPKWLYQLPETHRNCRNCLIARTKGQKFIPCHLRLINSEEGVNTWCKDIQEELEKNSRETLDVFVQLKESIIRNYELIESLYELQNNIEIHDRLLQLNSIKDVNEDLQLNMTLRDVSLFVKLNEKKIYVLDLDKKSAKKWRKWKEQEEKLQSLYEQKSELNCRVEKD